MKKQFWIVIVLAIIIIALLGILAFLPAKHNVQPVASGIEIASPKVNEEVSSPLKIKGVVSGNGWGGFEGQVGTVKLLDYKGNTLVQGILKATTDWMTSPVSFETTLDFQTQVTGPATLLFINENPSDMRDKDRTFTLPVDLIKSNMMKIDVFFGNQALSSSSEQDECKRVYRTSRYVEQTSAVAQAAIDELLKGPTDIEKAAGFFTNIPIGSKTDAIIRIVDGVAYVDFNKVTESGGGSCSMTARVAQITQTLLQFPTVTSVKLSINGRTGDIFQP